jgi:hypothetical protein
MRTRFGMRTFRFNPETHRAELNGKDLYLRGSNLAVYRFFEDAQRGGLVWDEAWIRSLYRKMKEMHWNFFRFHISFPPEVWYRLADEEGTLVQDEFPIWFGAYREWGFGPWPAELTTEEMVREYTEWVQDRWNHPCVVIWGGCNETLTDRTFPAIAKVRTLDLSDRPWTNSYNVEKMPLSDPMESHPYLFMTVGARLSDMPPRRDQVLVAGTLAKLDLGRPLIINEYAWLWLNRDGSTTSVTDGQYRFLLGDHSTVSQRRHLQALYTAAETECWRHWRKAAAVQHFVTLTCDRPHMSGLSAQTSPPWEDVASLTWQPEFVKYVRDAFAPVSVMVDEWEPVVAPGTKRKVSLSLINDLDRPWKGLVRLRILKDGKTVVEWDALARMDSLGATRTDFSVEFPNEPGAYEFQGTLTDTPEVSSWRTFTVSGTSSGVPTPMMQPDRMPEKTPAADSSMPPSPAAAH